MKIKLTVIDVLPAHEIRPRRRVISSPATISSQLGLHAGQTATGNTSRLNFSEREAEIKRTFVFSLGL
ncbi:MAG: hypothetical protein ACLR4Z_06425 [Butyricicoccaceae bacterium]